MRYESDYEWAAIKQFLPNKPRGVPRVNDRRVVARPSINNTVDGRSDSDHGLTQRGERVTGKSRVVTFRMDQATWDY